MAWIGPAIAAAGQVFSSIAPKLFGGGTKHNMIKSIVGDAQKAGIHPLYALGGAGAFGGSGYAGPEISWGDAAGAAGEAFSRFGDVWDRNYQNDVDRQEARTAREEERRFQSSRDLFQREMDREARQPTAQDQAVTGYYQALTRSELMRQKLMLQGASGGGNVSDPNIAIRGPGKAVWSPNSGSPAQSVENEYGNFIGDIYGGGKFASDLLKYLDDKYLSWTKDNWSPGPAPKWPGRFGSHP